MTGLGPDERMDELGRKAYRIIQNTKAFCFGMDAVLLAAFAEIRQDAKTADLGCGNGILPLLLKARDKGGRIHGLEIQRESAALALRNVALNGLEKEIQIIEADLRKATDYLEKNSYDAVLSNPPYIKVGAGLVNPEESKALARHEISCTIGDVLQAAFDLLKPDGRFYLVHRCWRMGEILGLLPGFGLSARRLRIVHSYPDSPGELFLLEAQKCRREGLKLEPPCVIFEADGQYTEEVYFDYYGKHKSEA